MFRDINQLLNSVCLRECNQVLSRKTHNFVLVLLPMIQCWLEPPSRFRGGQLSAAIVKKDTMWKNRVAHASHLTSTPCLVRLILTLKSDSYRLIFSPYDPTIEPYALAGTDIISWLQSQHRWDEYNKEISDTVCDVTFSHRSDSQILMTHCHLRFDLILSTWRHMMPLIGKGVQKIAQGLQRKSIFGR